MNNQIEFRASDEMYELIRKLAYERKVSMAHICRIAIKAYLSKLGILDT